MNPGFINTGMTVDGVQQPSSSSPLVKGQGVPVGNGLLRLYFEGRK